MIRRVLEGNRELIQGLQDDQGRSEISRLGLPMAIIFILLLIMSMSLFAFGVRLQTNVVTHNSAISSMSIKQSDVEVKIRSLQESLASQTDYTDTLDQKLASMGQLIQNQTEIIKDLYREIRVLRRKIRDKKSTIEKILRFLGLYYEPEYDEEEEEGQCR